MGVFVYLEKTCGQIVISKTLFPVGLFFLFVAADQ